MNSLAHDIFTDLIIVAVDALRGNKYMRRFMTALTIALVITASIALFNFAGNSTDAIGGMPVYDDGDTIVIILSQETVESCDYIAGNWTCE